MPIGFRGFPVLFVLTDPVLFYPELTLLVILIGGPISIVYVSVTRESGKGKSCAFGTMVKDAADLRLMAGWVTRASFPFMISERAFFRSMNG